MKNIFVTIGLITAFITADIRAQEDFRKKAPEAGPAPKIELGEAVRFELENGLKVIVVENHKLPRVTFQVFVDVPPFLEGAQTGYASIAGQLLATGTTSRSKAEIDEAVDFIGASLNTNSNGVTGSCLTKHQSKLLEIMSDVLFNPVFSEEEFEKIRKQTLSELAQAKEDPNAIAASVGAVLRNGKNHPYGELETEQSVKNITIDKCKEYYHTFFRPNISYLVVTGDIRAEEVRKIAQQYFGDWQPMEVKMKQYPTPQAPPLPHLAFVNKAGAVQSVIQITYPIDLQPGHPDAIKAALMNTILGSYFNSRLNSNLREDKAYTYGARSFLQQDRYVGAFTASASVRNEVTDSSLTQFLYELDKLRREQVGEEELQMVKNVMTGNFGRSLESPGTVARFYLDIVRYGLPEDYYATWLEKLAAVTSGEVLQMARKYVLPHRSHILVVGNRDQVADKLKVFSPDGEVHYYDSFGNRAEMVDIPVPEGITVEGILDKYIEALGGDEVKELQSVVIVMNAEVQGVVLENTLYHKVPNKLTTRSSIMGNIMQEKVFNGESGANIQMGQVSVLEGGDLEDARIESVLFAERKYKEMGVLTELKGIEQLDNGKTAYKVAVTYPSGSIHTYYYDTESYLKVRESAVREETVVNTDIVEYMEVQGIKFPKTVRITGAMPFPILLESQKVELNIELPDELFEYEE